jgi:predicted DNA-binding protein (MmcQ/YjbR family)
MASRLTAKELEAYCLAKPGAWPDHPWDHEYPVIKVTSGPGTGRIFAFLGADTVGVKAGVDREQADEWLRRFPDDVTVMRYIGRSGWNTISLRGSVPDDEIRSAVDDSYERIVSKLARKHRPAGWDRS